MNTPRSVAYGWGALIAATGIGYYYAKQANEKRWNDQRARGLRANPSDWKEKVEQDVAAAAGTASPEAPIAEEGESRSGSGRGRVLL